MRWKIVIDGLFYQWDVTNKEGHLRFIKRKLEKTASLTMTC
jgi:hypothetical protein